MPRRQKLELTWIGKEARPRLEPRILLPDPEHSYHAETRQPGDLFDNVLVHGDNLLALKALEADYAGKVKCVCIDPPYNTGSAFTHYDDGVEHSVWLSLMRDRLEIMRTLLADDGSLWVFVDDSEAHYLKVMLDELFGRGNFMGSITWQHSVQGKNDSKTISLHHNYILVYSKGDTFEMKRLPRLAKHNKAYSNPDDDPLGEWRSGDVRSPNHRDNLKYEVVTPSGNVIPPPDKGWRWQKSTFDSKVATGEISFVNDETRVLRKIYLRDQKGRIAESIWFGDEVGTTREATSELATLLTETVPFPTPKPERVIERILTIATDPDDLVLDSFLGSGTTAAVAHKMRRQWIGIELGDHAFTHVVPRLKKVVDGQDPGGVTEAQEWTGGGGFRTFRLAPSLMERDTWGRWVVNPEYNAEMLAEALCKHEGFSYAPSAERFWEHGHSTETDFVYVTTQTLTQDQLRFLSDEVGPDRTLLVLCAAWRGDADAHANLTLKKIPNAVLDRCEWGRDDYSLTVADLPETPPEPAASPAGDGASAPTLFDQTASAR